MHSQNNSIMKRLAFISIIILAMTSCKVKNEPVPTDEYEKIDLQYAVAYGDAHEEQLGEQLFAFAIGDVCIDDSGEVDDYSNGYYLKLILYADELNASTLFKPGTYTVSSTPKAWTFLRGRDADSDHPGTLYKGSLLYKVEDGFRTDVIPVNSGTITIDGSADNATFTIDIKDKSGKEYKYKYTGPVNMHDSLPAYDAFYAGYEKDSVQTITINADYAELKCYDSKDMFTLTLTNSRGGYRAMLAAYYQTSGNKTVGTFPVGNDPYDTTPGTTVYSRGCRDGNLYNSFAGVLGSDGNYDYVNYSLFFITGGSMTIDEDDNITAVFTSFYGSTVNVNFSGTIVRK